MKISEILLCTQINKLEQYISKKKSVNLKNTELLGRSKGFIDEYITNKRCHCDTNSQNR